DIRLLGWEMDDGAPDNIIYDCPTGTVSITCITYGTDMDPAESRSVTENDGLVRMLGQDLWWT
ncbi:hypothetical protein AARAC_009567, partial [Aspergillus arachidicola]